MTPVKQFHSIIKDQHGCSVDKVYKITPLPNWVIFAMHLFVMAKPRRQKNLYHSTTVLFIRFYHRDDGLGARAKWLEWLHEEQEPANLNLFGVSTLRYVVINMCTACNG